MPAIELRSVSHSYPDGRVALNDLDLRIETGERVAIFGPNGAGKTTLVLHLNGILRPSKGEVLIDGAPIGDTTVRDVRRRVGIVFQDPDDQLFMPTVFDDVAFGPANYGVKGGELVACVDRALRSVGMHEFAARVPHHLSGGEKRRVAVATVLAMNPSIMVFDEPSCNLDPRARRELADVIDQLDQTIVLVTHDLPYAAELCDRAVIIDGGTVVADGPIAEILADDDRLEAHALEFSGRRRRRGGG